MQTQIASPTVTHSTFVLERTFPTTLERVFDAFADPAKKSRWFADHESIETEEYRMDFKVGGTEYKRFRATTGLFAGTIFENHTVYHDIVEPSRIVFSYSMSMNGARFSTCLSTFEFLPAEEGTQLIFTEQAAFFEHADGEENRKQGWTHLLDGLAAELNR
jgi:uncharacterized protein YndB with AHSA1/START domain